MILPTNILERMNPADRKSLGKAGMTARENIAACDARNERELHKQIRALLMHRGIPFCEARMDRKSTITVGWPDITFAIDGVPVAFELKTGRNDLSKDQARVARDMLAHGWFYFVIRSLDEALEALRVFENLKNEPMKQ
jgi:hypothetical protein